MTSTKRTIRRYGLITALIAVVASFWFAADKMSDVPRPIPTTRPEMTVALETLEQRQPRIPLPTSADGTASASYLPEAWGGGGGLGGFGQTGRRGAPDRFGRYPDPRLDDLFSDPCFWVVSRANDCHYCLAHQELKLRAGGLDDNTIAALDIDWSRFDPRQRAALAFARKLTLEPHLVGDKDVANLRAQFTDAEIIELAFNVARFNSVNRWTDSLGFAPERHLGGDDESMLATPASEQAQHDASIVTPDTREPRGPLPDAAEIGAAIDACRTRTPRVTLPSATDAQAALGDALDGQDPLAWERALAALPEVGKTHVETWRRIMSDDHLDPRLKAELAYITAVNNRAWYAAGIAARRLSELGASPEQLAALIGGEPPESPGAGAAYRLAGKLTTDPHLITDADIASIREHFSDPESAQIVHVICMANLFDRLTESLGLPLE
jgi:alkylhydroperoxidase family enzyme